MKHKQRNKHCKHCGAYATQETCTVCGQHVGYKEYCSCITDSTVDCDKCNNNSRFTQCVKNLVMNNGTKEGDMKGLIYPPNYNEWDSLMQACFMIGVDAGRASIHNSDYKPPSAQLCGDCEIIDGCELFPEFCSISAKYRKKHNCI